MKCNYTWAAILMAACSAQASSFDAPDLQREKEMHRQFEQSRRPKNVSRGQEDYLLQNGETLRSLSQMLYGDAQYWPRVWAAKNNQLVRPGHTLQFLMGSEDETPSFRFSEPEDSDLAAQSIPSPLRLAASATAPIVEIPPPETRPRPVINLPTSFPQWQSVFREQEEATVDDRSLGQKLQGIGNRLTLSAYVQETPLEATGFFLEIDAEAGLPVANQYVFVKMKKGTGSPGMKLLVAKDKGPIIKVNDQYKKKKKLDAYLIQISGELELTESMPNNFKRDKDRQDFDTYRALITRSTGLSVRDSALIPGRLQMVDVDLKGTHGSVTAQVIGSEKNEASTIYGPGEIVFLDEGSSAGIQVGQLFDVFANRVSRHSKTPVPYSPAPSAVIKVVRVTDNLSTAVLVEGREGLQQGDQVHDVSKRGGDQDHIDMDEAPEMSSSSGSQPDAIEDDYSPSDSGSDSRPAPESPADDSDLENEIDEAM